MDILSHFPKKTLKKHIEQVELAAEFLMASHSKKTAAKMDIALLEKIIALHDIGKASSAFQEFITDPVAYDKPPQTKEHSRLSGLLSGLLLLKDAETDWKKMFVTLQIILGHHSSLFTMEELFMYWSHDDKIEIVKNQLSDYPKNQLFKIVNMSFDGIDLGNFCWDELDDFIDDEITESMNHGILPLDDAIFLRLKTQFLYSVLLESDKALLAVDDFEKHKKFQNRHDLKLNWIDKKIGTPQKTQLNELRSEIRKEVLKNSKETELSILSLTAPTGSGKTLLSASWAIIARDRLKQKGLTPKIIIILPFLSIISQTIKEYEDLLKIGGKKKDGSRLLSVHSLSDREYHYQLEEKEESFFIDTWRSDIIITTYDQFLYAIFNPKSKFQLRFHNLLDSIIIMDEVQSLPTKLWIPLEKILYGITELSEAKALLMSATLPSFVEEAQPLLPDFKIFFRKFNRYNLDVSDLKNNVSYSIEEFCDHLINGIDAWIEENERILFTLNTRKTAQTVFMAIQKHLKKNRPDYSMFFISADVIPKDRIKKIEKIKENNPCIVVSTQSIEAGVDIDMDMVIRDFAPLDSLIQIAGRCNRNGKKPVKTIKVVQIKSKNQRLFSGIIYDEVHLQKSRQILNKFEIIYEKDILPVAEKYFSLLMGRDGVNLGRDYINRFCYWKAYESIKTVLRGKNIDEYQFVLIQKDKNLKSDIQNIQKIKDRWERREKWQRISGRIAQVTLSVIANENFIPAEVAHEFHGLWILDPEYYCDDIGFNIPSDQKVSLIF